MDVGVSEVAVVGLPLLLLLMGLSLLFFGVAGRLLGGMLLTFVILGLLAFRTESVRVHRQRAMPAPQQVVPDIR